MTTASTVPVTRGEELEHDEALQTLRDCGRRRLLIDSVTRFRVADGFSHSRALAFQVTLTLLPALIAVVGLAAALEIESFTRVVRETIKQLAPGTIGGVFTEALEQGTSAARRESGETALIGGAVAAGVAGTAAMAQVERGANRLYGTEQDRPFVRKYLTGALLLASAGTLAVLSAVVLVGGVAIRDSVGWGDTLDAVWSVVRWPLGATFAVGAIALLFEHAPRRRQPEASWLAVGSAISALLWLMFMVILIAYVEVTGNFGATYGPIAGTIGVLLWTFASAVALFLGLAFAAQLEAVRAGITTPREERAEDL
jgi:YihY family inner membrane protein